MEPNCKNMTERILRLTLEIIYLLTGEDDIVVKKTSGDGQNSIMVPLHSFLNLERNNEQKILEVTKKILDLLMIESGNWRNCSVYIKEEIIEEKEEYSAIKEEKYLEGQNYLSKDVMMENQPPLTSPDGIRDRSQDSWDSLPKNHTKPHHGQDVEAFSIKTEIKAEEETHMRGNQLSMKEAEKMATITMDETSLDVSTGGHNGWNVVQGHLTLSEDYSKEDNNPAQISPGVNLVTQNIHHKPHQTDSENSFKEKHDLVEPKRIHSNTTPYMCSECGMPFIKKSNFIDHLRVHTGEKPFSCSECEKSFTRKSTLVQHQKIHTGEKPYSCSECERSFKNKSNLMVHQRVHTGEKPYSCSECGKSFKYRSNLVAHLNIHTSEKNISCPQRNFMNKAVLIQQQNIHTSEKPYSCSECEKFFTRKSTLVEHQRMHSGDKCLSCSECKRPFIRKSKLVQHQRIHTGEKPFLCTECGKSFRLKSMLETHMRTHTGEKPFSCPKCGKCFTQKESLIVHQIIHTTSKKHFSCS